MNVALVVHDFDPRFGQGRYAVELVRRLAVRHEVCVYANTFAPPLEPNVTWQKIPVCRAGALATVLTFWFNSQKILRRRHHDLIHAQGLTCRAADVITAHICNAERRQRSPAAGWRQRIFSAVAGPLEARFYRQPRARQLIAISRQVASEITAHYGWDRETAVIYHGTDTETFCPAANPADRAAQRRRFQLPPVAWVWLFVGEAAKGLREVIVQLPSFPGATLLVISRSGLEPCRQLAARLNVADRIRFHGPESETWRAYQAADVLVHPSVYDAFGLVVAEAMAAELPVIAGRSIGAAEWIVPEKNGLLCDPADPATLRAALEWLRADSERARTLGRAARVTVRQHSWDACAAATEAVYERVLARRKGT